MTSDFPEFHGRKFWRHPLFWSLPPANNKSTRGTDITTAKKMTSSVPSAALSAHRDVLEAPIPDSDDAKARLVEELKNRGRAAVGAKSWRDASLLYKKATEISPDDAILYSNLALTQINMGMYEQARVNAERSTELDASYLKGFWRLGQALAKLNRTDEALEAMQKALALEPTNKALAKEVARLQAQVKEEEELMKMDIDTPSNETKVELPPPVKPKTTSTPTKKPESSTKKPECMEEDAEDGLFTQSDHVRGYKVVNGKKTSYFHRELSEEEKNMIGDIAPKRIDTTAGGETQVDNAPQLLQPAVPDGASAWNKAGTWEERDATAWAKETLKSALVNTSYTLPDSSPAPGAVAKVTKVLNLDGHASYATVRGKKKYIYEFLITIKWEFSHEGKEGSGSMSFPDFDGTCELGEGYEMVQYSVDPETSPALRPVLDRFVKNDGLRSAIHGSLDDWVRLFKSTY